MYAKQWIYEANHHRAATFVYWYFLKPFKIRSSIARENTGDTITAIVKETRGALQCRFVRCQLRNSSYRSCRLYSAGCGKQKGDKLPMVTNSLLIRKRKEKLPDSKHP